MKPESHQFEDRLLEFAYGELPPLEAGAVEAHVRGCERCQRALAEIRSVRSAMQRLPLEEAPAAGLESLLAYAQGQAERNARAAPRPWWKVVWGGRWLAPLGTMAALALVVVAAWRTQGDAYQPAPAAVALQAEEARSRSAEGAPAAVAAAPVPPPAAASPAAEPLTALAKASGPRQAQVQHADALEKREAKAVPKGGDLLARKKVLTGLGGAEADYSNAAAVGALGSASAGGGSLRQGYGLGAADKAAASPAAAPEAELAEAAAKDDTRRSTAEVASGQPAVAPGSAAPAALATRASLPLSTAESRRAGPARDEAASSPAAAASVAAARKAGAALDRAAELRHALLALQAGVAGAERSEMLSRGCGAAEALGDAAQADRLCDQLLLEYPGTPAAEALTARRGRVQSAPLPASKPAPAKAAPPVKR